MKNIDPDQVWKQKYYDSIDELESKEKQWCEIESLLRNVAIKMSLALDGIDYAFDQKLIELRKIFRGKPADKELRNIIHSITNSLDKVDQAKQSGREDGERVRQTLLTVIGCLPVPRVFTGSAKTLKKELQTCDSQSQLQSGLERLKTLLLDTIDHYQRQATDSKRKPGLLSRMFAAKAGQSTANSVDSRVGTGNPVDTGVGTANNSTAEITTSRCTRDSSDSALIEVTGDVTESINLQSGIDVIRVISQKLRLGDDADKQIRSSQENLNAINSGQSLLEVAEQLSATINRFWPRLSQRKHDRSESLSLNDALVSLLDKMSLPENLNTEIADLQARLQQQINDAEWPDVLEKIACLVSGLRENVQREKREFEQYLSNLTQRLKDIDNTLRSENSSRRLVHEQCLELDQVMNREVADIRSQIQSKSEIEPLKLAIEDRLSAIATHMHQYRLVEESRNQQAEQKINELTQRLQMLQSESRELKKKVVKQRQLAMLDRLTGIPNRMAYDERLEQEYRRWRRFHENLCLMVIDIDFFKKINDNFGHKAGDRVLAKIAGLISECTRETDYVARYGGEEFTVLMTGAKINDALRVANGIREAIADCGFHFREQSVPVTVSAGLAQFTDNDTPEDVFERADQALYKAKNAGRNRCCH